MYSDCTRVACAHVMRWTSVAQAPSICLRVVSGIAAHSPLLWLMGIQRPVLTRRPKNRMVCRSRNFIVNIRQRTDCSRQALQGRHRRFCSTTDDAHRHRLGGQVRPRPRQDQPMTGGILDHDEASALRARK